MSTDTSSAPDYQYWAFISYSHQDNLLTRGDGSTDHIQWANWLHEQLETFRVPNGYRDRLTRTGEPMPERFFPTFRDEAELPTSHDLGGQIRDALERSRFLIVIASPRSARSRYVNEEVRYFRELGRGDRILVLITDGEPNVRLHPKAGWTAADDCFCPALVHPLKADGTVDDTQLLSEEPIAADVRVKDTEPPREMRAKESTQDARRALLDFMKLKLIADLMGVGLDELVQRDKARQLEQAKMRTRRAAVLTLVFGILAMIAASLGVVAWIQKHRADEQTAQAVNAREAEKAISQRRAESLAEAARSDRLVALEKFASGQPSEGLPYLARAIAYQPDSSMPAEIAVAWANCYLHPVLTHILQGHERPVISAEFSPNGQRIVTASQDKTARVLEANSGKLLATLQGHEHSLNSAQFSADGHRIVTTSDDTTARVWEADSGKLIATLQGDGGLFQSAEFSADGQRIVAASSDDTARVWETDSGKLLVTLQGHEGSVNSAQFSPDGHLIITASDDRTAQVWEADSGKLLVTLQGHEDSVNSAQFSPDGHCIVTASRDRTARVWVAGSGRLLATLKGHEGEVVNARFSPNGKRIITASADYTAWVWEVGSYRLLPMLQGHEARVWSAQFSSDGQRVVTASLDKTARVWLGAQRTDSSDASRP